MCKEKMRGLVSLSHLSMSFTTSFWRIVLSIPQSEEHNPPFKWSFMRSRIRHPVWVGQENAPPPRELHLAPSQDAPPSYIPLRVPNIDTNWFLRSGHQQCELTGKIRLFFMDSQENHGAALTGKRLFYQKNANMKIRWRGGTVNLNPQLF